ncbi:MAG: hypothetical protein E1N59_2862 [Puniceicoccaceae bacterium 5H]|nr:MAG: hypothetical protein E1N59_2862 [Puniceicoccaceae bacterium 5H]
MKNTHISWATHTWNPWIGCTKVSPGCTNCYAKAQNDRFKGGNWGIGAPRRRTGAANWRQPIRLNAEAERTGNSPRVFLGSMMDIFDPEVPVALLADTLDIIRQTPHLTWLLLTKRPELWYRQIFSIYTPDVVGKNYDLLQWLNDWLCAADEIRGVDLPSHHLGKKPPQNVWIGTTVEDQPRADERIPHLLRIPARVRFLSCEPLLGPVDLTAVKQTVSPGFFGDCLQWYHQGHCHKLEGTEYPTIHWVICGGESGPNARPMHPDWARSLRDQCKAAGVPFHFKQWGEWIPDYQRDQRLDLSTLVDWGLVHSDGGFRAVFSGGKRVGDSTWLDGETGTARLGKKATGRELDDEIHNAFPEVSHG